MKSTFSQPVIVLMTVFIEDRKIPGIGRKYGLLRIGSCYYPIVYKNPDIGHEDFPSLDGHPVQFLHKQEDEQGFVNEHGFLFFTDRNEAVSRFKKKFVEEAYGEITYQESEDESIH